MVKHSSELATSGSDAAQKLVRSLGHDAFGKEHERIYVHEAPLLVHARATSNYVIPRLPVDAYGCCLQVQQYEDEKRVHLPAVVRINDSALTIWLHRLVCFTGTRFLSSAAKTIGAETKADVAAAVTAEVVKFPVAELPCLKQLLLIMENKAPTTLTLPQVDALISMCKYCMADSLFQGFGDYLLPIVSQLQSTEVRLEHSLTSTRSNAAQRNGEELVSCI